MKAFASFLVVLALAAPLSSCAPSFDTPPDLQPLLQAYAQPTAVVGSQIMSEWADKIAKAAEEIQDSEIFEEILQVIIDVQQELDAATVKTCDGGAMNGSNCSADADCPDGTCVSTGDVVLGQICDGGTNDGGDCTADTDCPDGGTCGGGVVVPTPTGEIRVNYICPGWDERQFDPDYEAEPDPANGRITLTMTLDSGGIGRVVWGTADNCLYLVPTGRENFQASYDGGVALDLGDPEPSGQDITKLIVTFLMEGEIGFDGGTYGIKQSFRVTLENTAALVILVDLADPADPALSETFNYIFGESSQGIRDATGLFQCSLEESRCWDESGTLFSW
jgi:hypothetical protein